MAAVLIAVLNGVAARAGSLLDLVLVLDGSGSISNSEFTLQREAYASAFESQQILDLVRSAAPSGGLRLAVVVFATSARTAIDWTPLTSEADSLAFASAFRQVGRSGVGSGTRIDLGLDQAWTLFDGLDDPSDNLMVDVSGDGTSNATTTRAARDRLAALGVDRINGLAIGTATIANFYRDNVMHGDDAFVLRVDTFDLFEQAIYRKLEIEIGSVVVPEPSSIVMATIGLALATAAGAKARRRLALGA